MPRAVFRRSGEQSTQPRAFRHSASTSTDGNAAPSSETRAGYRCHSFSFPSVGKVRMGFSITVSAVADDGEYAVSAKTCAASFFSEADEEGFREEGFREEARQVSDKSLLVITC